MLHLKTTTLALFIFATININAQWWGKGERVKGNGNITTIKRTTASYDAIKAAGPMDFVLVPGNEGNISIKGDANLLDYVITEVKANKLHLKLKKGYNIRPTKSIMVTVPYGDISSISLAGSGDVTNKGTIKSSELNIALAGSGDMNLKLNTDKLSTSIAGSGDIKLSGSTRNLELNIAGSGDFNSSSLKSTNTTVKIAGSGDANVHCDGGELKVRINGSGDVKYTGKPASKDTKINGSGSISG